MNDALIVIQASLEYHTLVFRSSDNVRIFVLLTLLMLLCYHCCVLSIPTNISLASVVIEIIRQGQRPHALR